MGRISLHITLCLLITIMFIFYGCKKDESTPESSQAPLLREQIIGKWKVNVEYIKDYYLSIDYYGDTCTFRDDEFEYFYDSTYLYFYSDSTFWFDVHDNPASLSPGSSNNWGSWKPMPDAFDNEHLMITDLYFPNCDYYYGYCFYSTIHVLILTPNSLVFEYSFDGKPSDYCGNGDIKSVHKIEVSR